MRAVTTCSRAGEAVVRSVANNRNPSSEKTVSSRRSIIGIATLAPLSLSLTSKQPAFAVELPPAAPLGDCADCLGEVNNTLNACTPTSQSCVSTLNDDEAHFEAPWQYDISTADAVESLVHIATGGDYKPGLIATPFGVSRGDAAEYIARGVLAVLQNGEMPERPKRRRQAASVPFDGVLAEQKTTSNGSEYVRITFGTKLAVQGDIVDPSEIIDAEFLFLPGDSIVNVRAVSRGEPERGELALSYTQGIVVDRNIARKRMDALRTALRWELAAVLTDFSPQFNPQAPEFVEKIFKPFDDRSRFQPSGMSYPSE